MDTIFMNSENSKTSKPHILKLKLTDKLDLRLDKKVILHYQILAFIIHGIIYKVHIIIINLKYLHQHGTKNLHYQMNLKYSKKAQGKINNDKPSVKIYINKVENRITFKIKNEYSLEVLTKETMKLLGSTENKITKDKNGENVPHLEITEVVLVHCNMVNNDYQQDSRVIYTFVPNKFFGSLLDIFPSNHIFLKTFNSEYDEIVVWFTDQNSKPLEIGDRINLTMVVK